MSDVLRGAVVGAGYFSQFHFDAWSRMDDVTIVACCDVDEAKATAAAKEYKIPHVYTDLRAMLDEQTLDFVDVITLPSTHLSLCQEVAQRGVALICQKPLAPTCEEAHQIVRLTADARVPFMVHENFRFQPWYREIKQLLENHAIGSRLHTISFRNRAGDGWGDNAYLARQPYFQKMKRFLIFEAGIHTIDTFRYLAGEVDRVWCQLRRLNPVIAGEDAAILVFQFQSGATGIYDANRYNESTAKNQRYTFGEMLLEGSGGSIRLYDDGRITLQPLGEPERDHPYIPSDRGVGGDSVLATQQHFIERLRRGEPFETDGPSYLRSIAIQEAAYRSSFSEQWERPI